MAEKRRKSKKSQEEPQDPTKEEYAVADFLRFNVPTREGKLRGLPVTCFFASKAVDALLDSKWATNKGKTEPLFTNRQSCVDYCNELLIKGLFHRGFRMDKKKDKDKDKKSKKTEAVKDEKSDKAKKSKKKAEKENEEKESDKEKEKEVEKKIQDKKDDEKKKKKKIKIEMHDEQIFVDGDEVYVWIHDPTPFKNKVIGLLLVLGAIGVCLFPLWPPEVRLGVYYLSLAAACFVGFILSLCIIRLIVFCIVWAVTFGKHHLWLLPNLTEDVGFFDSFKPLYNHERSDSGGEDKDDKDSKSKDDTKEEETTEQGDSKAEKVEDTVEKDLQSNENEDGSENDSNGGENNGTEHSDSNGYEMVSHQDLDRDSDKGN